MIKVGIMSMQRICNYGSFLQAYALREMLKEEECKVEFVDYHAGKCLVNSGQGSGIKRKLSKVLETIQYNASLNDKIKFIKYKKNYASKYYSILGIDEHMNYCPKVDLLIIGSDEVFNCVQDNTNVGFSKELFGAGNRAGKLVTYAASFGNTTLKKLKKYNVDRKVSGWLKKFDNISVRDENSGKIIEKLTGRTPIYNLDPVLAYDYMNKCKKIPAEKKKGKYMILYGYAGRFSSEECRFIRRYADKKGLKIICIGGIQSCCDEFIDCSPFEVLAYFRDAECVVTDTFHGTIMSVINHRKFVSVVRTKGYGNSEKLTDLLKRLHLTERIVEDVKIQLYDVMEKKFSYDATDEIITAERTKASDYLRKVIHETENR